MPSRSLPPSVAMRGGIALTLAGTILLATTLTAQTSPSARGADHQELLTHYCITCHNDQAMQGGLTLQGRDLVNLAARAEADKGKGLIGFAEAVAVNAAKLMAYKDEYEVARLYTDKAFHKSLEAQIEGDLRPRIYLAPPLLARPDPTTGEPRKRAFGPWVFTLFKYLARLKGLRGGPLDVFARSAERRAERRLVKEYFDTVREIVEALSPETHALTIELARLPEQIRGFGLVKMRSIEAADHERAALLVALRAPEIPATAVE